MTSTNSTDYIYFRKLLTRARKEQGKVQEEVASYLGKPQSFVSKYESGERRLDVVEFIEVARALNIDPKDLIAELEKRR
jgi:transcriptional regulator with XRE-family HTH domain